MISLKIQKALANPDVIKRLEAISLIPQGGTPEALGELLASDTKRWGDVMTRAKIAKQ